MKCRRAVGNVEVGDEFIGRLNGSARVLLGGGMKGRKGGRDDSPDVGGYESGYGP